MERFRTPAWRPYRAGMFVALGLSAVFPIFHGLELYGIHEMRDRIGLVWLVLQGFLYILGAGLYAVSLNSVNARCLERGTDDDRLAGRNALRQANLISGGAHIRYFTCWW